MIPFGRDFYKMSGSGNDFVFVDAREGVPESLTSPDVVSHICRRGTGIGADGVVFLQKSQKASVALTYLNADGSRADLCGNATLCTARLARELGVVTGKEFTIETDVGVLGARFIGDQPEIDLQPVTEVRPEAGIPLEKGEQRMGFALAGVPHLVILVDELQSVDVVGRGRPLRRHKSLAYGANVNFVAALPDGRFAYRTYERGVEAETLACGTGAVATAVLLTVWGLAKGQTRLQTRSGRELSVRLSGASDRPVPSLSGEGRIVFRGSFGELDLPTDLRELQLGSVGR
ncbi:MAG TPA: diaminopimelate epimerase [Gemmatimonadaceae bacterium]|nr:diaminopimelate epimerase [Gemmatimonadaceae bacterium]